jgi:phenylacetate-CoA ligase
MAIYNFISRNMLAPVLDFSRGTQTMKCLKELESSQWWPRNRIMELQNERLKILIRQAYEHVPYYRRLFDERSISPGSIQCAGDLIRLPLLTKQMVKTHSAELIATNFCEKQLVKLVTNGSTGEPLVFYRTRQDQLSWGFAASQRAFGWAGYRLGDKLARVSAMRPYHSRMQRFSEVSKRFFERVLMLDAKTVSTKTLPECVSRLKRFQPKIIWGYPNTIETLARFIQKEGKSGLKVKSIISGAEQLYDYQRELFSSVFGCDTFSNYSAWEAHSIAVECAKHSGHHISSENLIVEIVDNASNPLPTGQEGRVVITNLHNFGMPFIRYCLNDLAVATDQECQCGRGLPLLASLSGRTVDMIYTRSSKAISGTALVHLFHTPMGIRQFQLVQEQYDKVTIKLNMDQDFSSGFRDDLVASLARRLKAILGEDMEIAVEFVDFIPTTTGGKLKPVITSLKQTR